MKANYHKQAMSRKVISIDKAEDIIREEWDRKVDLVYKSATQDAGNQILAVLFTALHKDFGFGRERLIRVKKSMESYFKLMNDNVFQNGFSPQDCLDYIKKEFDIDLDQEGMFDDASR